MASHVSLAMNANQEVADKPLNLQHSCSIRSNKSQNSLYISLYYENIVVYVRLFCKSITMQMFYVRSISKNYIKLYHDKMYCHSSSQYPKNPNPKFLSGLCRNLGFSRDHEEKDVFFQ